MVSGTVHNMLKDVAASFSIIENEAATSLSMLWTVTETMEILPLACDESF